MKALIIIVSQASSQHVEFYLRWCYAIISAHSSSFMTSNNSHFSLKNQECLRSLVRAIGKHEKEVMEASELNQYNLCFLVDQSCCDTDSNESGGNPADMFVDNDNVAKIDTHRPSHDVEKSNRTDEWSEKESKKKKRKVVK